MLFKTLITTLLTTFLFIYTAKSSEADGVAFTTYSMAGCHGRYQLYDFKDSVEEKACKDVPNVSHEASDAQPPGRARLTIFDIGPGFHAIFLAGSR